MFVWFQTVPKVQNDDPMSLTVDLLNSKSIVFDSVSRTTTVPSFKSFCSGDSFYHANTPPNTHPPTYTYIMIPWSQYWRQPHSMAALIIKDDTVEWRHSRKTYGRIKQKFTFQGLANIPTRSPISTHTHHQGSSWGLPVFSINTKGSWLHLGGGSPHQASRQPLKSERTTHLYRYGILESNVPLDTV